MAQIRFYMYIYRGGLEYWFLFLL